MLIFLGAILLVICIALMYSNMSAFIVFFSLYIGMFIVILMVYLYKKISTRDKEFNTVISISIYTLCLLIVVVLYCIYQMLSTDNTSPPSYGPPARYNQRW
jgi:hypothetical protein